MSESLYPLVGHLSILLEAVKVVSFSIFHFKICLFRQLWIFLSRIFLIIMLQRDMCAFHSMTSLFPTVFFVSV